MRPVVAIDALTMTQQGMLKQPNRLKPVLPRSRYRLLGSPDFSLGFHKIKSSQTEVWATKNGGASVEEVIVWCI